MFRTALALLLFIPLAAQAGVTATVTLSANDPSGSESGRRLASFGVCSRQINCLR